jgi:hypothetical protein
MYQLCHDHVVEIIKADRLRWAGHLARMDGELAKILTSGKPEEKRVQSRPKFRWLDSIKKSKNTESQQLVAEGVDE